MNWTRIDNNTEATEIAGAGCFVRFFNNAIPVFAPGVTIKKDTSQRSFLVAAPVCGTHISFTADGSTSTTGWIGDAGDKLDAKLEKLNRKKGQPESLISVTTFDGTGPAKVDWKKFKKVNTGGPKAKKKKK